MKILNDLETGEVTISDGDNAVTVGHDVYLAAADHVAGTDEWKDQYTALFTQEVGLLLLEAVGLDLSDQVNDGTAAAA